MEYRRKAYRLAYYDPCCSHLLVPPRPSRVAPRFPLYGPRVPLRSRLASLRHRRDTLLGQHAHRRMRLFVLPSFLPICFTRFFFARGS